MSIFPPHDIESMNEDDVAGELCAHRVKRLATAKAIPMPISAAKFHF
jgi:hypothetical protein